MPSIDVVCCASAGRLARTCRSHPGAAPALSEVDVQDIVAFLRTLTDADVQAAMPPAR